MVDVHLLKRASPALAALVLAVALAPSPVGATAPTARFASRAAASATDVSSNWAGYVATGPGSTATIAAPSMSYTDVTGQWVQPKATCAAGSPTSVAVWVGLGGYSETSQELEQAGTSADCSESGKATYYIWYELVPADSVNVKSLKINAGDVIASVVKVNGTDVLVQVIDRTRKTRFTKHLTMATPDLTSAEWIAEAPSSCSESGFCRQIALTNFGSLTFTRSFATGNGTGGTISSPNWELTGLQLVPRSHRFYGDPNDSAAGGYGGAGANPSAVSSDGTGFGVTWQANPVALSG
jgi:hypothetical protein